MAATGTPDLAFWLTVAFALLIYALEISLHLSYISYLLTLMEKS
jgi:hypothetical protein